MYDEENINEHPVQQKIEECIKTFDSEANGEQKEFFLRLVQLCRIVSDRISSVDFYVAPTYMLDAINNNLNKSINEYNSYKSNNNTNHLNNIERQIEGALVNSKHLFVASGDIEKDYSEVLSNFRKSAGQHLRYFESHANEIRELYEVLDKDIKGLNKQIEQQKNRLDKVVSDFQAQVSDFQQKQLSEFQEKQNSRENLFKESLNELKSSYSEQLEKLKSKTFKSLSDISEYTSDLITDIREKRDEALKLVGIVANTGMAGGYQKIANQAMWTKSVWQSLTVISLFGLIGFSIYMYSTTIANGTDISLGAAGIRVFVTIAIALFAGYSAKQADINSKIERRNRQMEIELSSIDMFIAKMDETQQLEIKKELSEKFFGNLPLESQKIESKSHTTVMGHLSEAIRNFSEKLDV